MLRKLFNDPTVRVSIDAACGCGTINTIGRVWERCWTSSSSRAWAASSFTRVPGLMTEYLSTDWFRLWKQSMEEGKRLGLLVNIYDENSYPSGFAGGHVPSMVPDTAAQYVQAELDVPPGAIFQRRGVTVAFFAVDKDARNGADDVRSKRYRDPKTCSRANR